MQTSLQKVEHSIHQKIEQALRHPVVLVCVLSFMAVALFRFDTNVHSVFKQAYVQGFGWVGMYMHHEHPAHGHVGVAISRPPTISGSDA